MGCGLTFDGMPEKVACSQFIYGWFATYLTYTYVVYAEQTARCLPHHRRFGRAHIFTNGVLSWWAATTATSFRRVRRRRAWC